MTDRRELNADSRTRTTVVNIKYDDDYDVYIGRRNTRKRLPASDFGNPFMVGKDGTQEEVVGKYRDWLPTQPHLMARIKKELQGKRLGCYCKPKVCHGDVLAELADKEG